MACSSKAKKTPDANAVDVYYINTKTSALASESYDLSGTNKDDQIKELLMMLKKTPDNVLYKSALPEGLVINFSYDKNGSLVINFDDSYSNVSGVTEVLCRAAIVKTISQIKGVEYIQFSVNEQPLKVDGNVVGPLTAEDFVDNTETSNSYYKVKLYFANKKGNGLIEYLTSIKYTGTESIEELAIQQLINGPTKAGMYSTIPEGTVLLNVSKTGGICTVDFNEKFLEKLPNISEKVAIYSVVNTLVELPDINKVQFTINGKVKKVYWEDMQFNVPFESKLGLIKNAE